MLLAKTGMALASDRGVFCIIKNLIMQKTLKCLTVFTALGLVSS